MLRISIFLSISLYPTRSRSLCLAVFVRVNYDGHFLIRTKQTKGQLGQVQLLSCTDAPWGGITFVVANTKLSPTVNPPPDFVRLCNEKEISS